MLTYHSALLMLFFINKHMMKIGKGLLYFIVILIAFGIFESQNKLFATRYIVNLLHENLTFYEHLDYVSTKFIS
jgi:hypothetical protein